MFSRFDTIHERDRQTDRHRTTACLDDRNNTSPGRSDNSEYFGHLLMPGGRRAVVNPRGRYYFCYGRRKLRTAQCELLRHCDLADCLER